MLQLAGIIVWFNQILLVQSCYTETYLENFTELIQ